MGETATASVQIVEEIKDEQQALASENNAIVAQADSMQVTSATEYQDAAEFVKQIKTAAKKVSELFADPCKKAFEAHKAIKAAENAMANPLAKAEQIIKRKMSDYDMEQRRLQQKAEAEQRQRMEEEKKRLMEEAAKSETNGDQVAAEIKMAQAMAVESMKPVAQVATPTVQGISRKVVWKAEIIDEKKVPVEIAGMVVRPVDMSAINKLAQTSKGKVEIPGIRIYEDSQLSVR